MCVSSMQLLPLFADTGVDQTHEQEEKISQHQQQHGHEKEEEKQI